MKINIKNYELSDVIDLLNSISSKGIYARSLSKIKQLIQKKFVEYCEDEVELLKEYCVLDETGALLMNENGHAKAIEELSDICKQSQKELAEQDSIINLVEFEPHLNNVIELLEKTEKEFIGKEADVYDLILTKLEKMKEEVS